MFGIPEQLPPAAGFEVARRFIRNGHGKDATPDNKTRHARFPLSNFPPQAGERANETLREFYVSGHHEATLVLTMKNIRVITDIHGIKPS